MWFCCQLWQCNLRACLGPLDVWKAWNGWSHVVHPCRAPAAPTTFLDARARDESEKAAATSSLTTGSTKTTPSGSRHISHLAQRELCEVAVEIHQHEGRPSSSGASLDDGSSGGGGGGGAALGASGGGGGGGGARSASDSVAGTATTASVAGSSAASVTSDASSLSGASVASGTGSSGSSAGVDAPLELRAGHGSAFGARAKTGAGAARPQHPLEFTGMTSPLGVLVEWEAEDEEDEELGGEAEDLTPSPQRPPSTDWTTLESNLDFWRQEHTRRPPRSDEDERSSKVRYNDTGSLEEVNLEQMVEYYVDDDLSLSPEVDHESLRMQYRQIWELRATLEEDEDLSDPGIITTKAASDTEMESQISRSSPDQSPEMEMPTSHTTSFESNTEPLLEEAGGLWACAAAAAAAAAAAGAAQATGAGAGAAAAAATSAALQLPSYESRRQTYRNVLSWRLRHLESRRHQVATAAVTEAGSAAANSAATTAAAAVATVAATASSGRQPSLEDTSFDSVETADTEGSSTDASRLEQATTSFESTTDNTDSAGDSQAHRLQQLRADSGYRSLENPPAAPPKLSRRQLPLADSTDLDAPPRDADAKLLWLASLGDSGVGDSAGLAPGAKGSLGGVRARRLALGDSGEPDHDEGVAELQSPPHPDQPAPWDGRRKACTRSASKKRREFGGGSGSCGVTASAAADAIVAADVEPPPPPPAQPHLHRCHAVYTRDYSVDEKSDALFREFSRCDPTQQPELLPRGQRLGGPGAYRRHSHAHAHHSRHGHYAAAAAGAYPYARAEAAVRKASAAAAPVSASTAAAAPALALGAVPGVAAVAVAVVAAPAAAPAPDKTFAGPGAATVTAMRHDVLTAALPVIRVADEDAADHV
ncbi:hypothetical protein R5R35_008275 [Gryllus longicercus]|uniref:Uncharacterized protein n=1 Tax=Gryllus longicercus TaxID=2509291 RepID=A0AAN9V1F0_9ORTH